MKHFILGALLGAVHVLLTVAVVCAAPATWRVVETSRVDVACYAHWRAVLTRSADDGERAEANGHAETIVHRHTIPEWWAGNGEVRDLALPHYEDFQGAVARQLNRESDESVSAWLRAPRDEWELGRAACLQHHADIMRDREELAACIEGLHCTTRWAANI